MSIFTFTPQMKSAGPYFGNKNIFLGHTVLFVRINYEDVTNLSLYFFIILGVTMESALQLLSPLIAVTPTIMPHHE